MADDNRLPPDPKRPETTFREGERVIATVADKNVPVDEVGTIRFSNTAVWQLVWWHSKKITSWYEGFNLRRADELPAERKVVKGQEMLF